MESISISANTPARTSISFSGVPVYIYATVLSSLSIMIGLIWDISWHMSIGRDGLFSPPHLAIYLGGVTAGLFSGFRILKVSFAGNEIEKQGTVKFWGVFHGSLGNLFCVWGAIAMLTSAPFDDWWHNTYGLDVTILSPPHTVLLLGMITIQFGALTSVLKYQNDNAHQENTSMFNLLFAMSGGFLLTMLFTIASEELSRHEMHNVSFYKISAVLFPLFLVAFSMAAKSRWGATSATAVYTIFLILMSWILPLFPATPLLGPVLNPVTNFQPFDFPLLLIVPAFLIDILVQRMRSKNAWLLALALAPVFVLSFILVQWPFANVLMASKGHWLLGTSKWYFGSDPTWEFRYAFGPWMETSGMGLVIGILTAVAFAFFSLRVGLSLGRWMQQVIR